MLKEKLDFKIGVLLSDVADVDFDVLWQVVLLLQVLLFKLILQFLELRPYDLLSLVLLLKRLLYLLCDVHLSLKKK